MLHLKSIFRKTYPGQVRWLFQIGGRPNLPGSSHPGFPQSLNGPTETLPFIMHGKDYGITMDSSPESCAQAINGTFKDLVYKHSAIHLRDFPLGDLDKFTMFLKNLNGVKRFGYDQGTGVRHALNDQVMAASDYSNEMTIEPHNEMSPNVKHPKLISFACKQAGNGGESVLVDCAAWYEQLDKSVKDEFDKRGGGIMYHLYLKEDEVAFNGQKLGADISWRYVFNTKDKSEVEAQLKNDNREFRWHNGNDLQFWYFKPTSIKHHKLGSPLWFNQIHSHHLSFYNLTYPDTWGKSNIPHDKYPVNTYYADGTTITEDVLQHVRNVAWRNAVGFKLQKNDVILVDNERLAHARLNYTGDRTLYAALLDDAETSN